MEHKNDDLYKYLGEQVAVEFTALQRTLDLNAEDTAFAIHQIIHTMHESIGETDYSTNALLHR